MKKINYLITLLAIIMTISACKKEDASNPTNISSVKNQSQNIVKSAQSIMDNPVLVWSSSSQPNPSIVAPAIFYSPHQDDETIGMGASIAEHVRAGRPVYVVLLTNGANTGMLAYLQTLNPNSTMQNVINARNNEFIAACIALGVHRIYIANVGSGYDESIPFLTLKTDFKNTMSYMRNLFPSASHKTVSGNCDSYNPNCDKMPTHQAAATAIHELYNTGVITDIRLYRVYCYYWNYGTCDRCSSWFKPVSSSDKLRRQSAINQYKYVNTSIQRYGLAYWHSVSALFDNSWDSNYEYVDYIENDY